MRRLLLLTMIVSFFIAHNVHAQEIDLSIDKKDIYFSDEGSLGIKKGMPTRMNIIIRNIGDSIVDRPFYVEFKEVRQDGSIEYRDVHLVENTIVPFDFITESFLWTPKDYGLHILKVKVFEEGALNDFNLANNEITIEKAITAAKEPLVLPQIEISFDRITEDGVVITWRLSKEVAFDRLQIYMASFPDFKTDETTLIGSVSPDSKTFLMGKHLFDRIPFGLLGAAYPIIYFAKVRLVIDKEGSMHCDSSQVPIFMARPVTLCAKKITSKSIVLRWDKNTNPSFTGYKLYMSKEKDFKADSANLVFETKDEDVTEHTIDKLQKDTSYYFRLITRCWNVDIVSNELPLKTMAKGATIALEKCDEESITSNSVKLKWSVYNSEDFRSYIVCKSDKRNFAIDDSTVAAVLTDLDISYYKIMGLASNSTYYFKIRAVDKDGNFIDSNEIKVATKPNQPPMASIDSITPNPAHSEDEITLIGYGQDPDGKVVEYKWISSIDGVLGTDSSIKVRNLSKGEHKISFMVKDDANLWSQPQSVNLLITLPNEPPKALIESISPTPAHTRDEITLIGYGQDPDGKVVEYKWISSIDGVLGTDSSIKVRNLSKGEHKISFMVKDDANLWSQPQSVNLLITLPNEPPKAVIESISPSPATLGVEIGCIGFGNDTDGSVERWQWDFGDGTVVEGVGNSSFVSKRYITKSGEFKIKFRVCDNGGVWSDDDVKTITVVKPVSVENISVEGPSRNIDKAKKDSTEGQLLIDSQPDGADVFIDDAFAGVTPLSIHLATGFYNLRLVKENFKEYNQKVFVSRGKTIKIDAKLH